MAIFQLLYRSQSRGEISKSQVQQILDASVRNNGRREITGLLLYNGKIFLQMLEGEESAVRRCYEKICLDSRHSQAFIVAEVRSEQRIFPNWKMGYIDMKPTTAANDLSPMLRVAAGHGTYDASLIVKILREYATEQVPSALVDG